MNVLQLTKKHFHLKQKTTSLKRKIEIAKELNEVYNVEALEEEYSILSAKLKELEDKEVFFNEDLESMLESTEQLQDTLKCVQGFIDNVKKIER